jgi:hypothetical protein
MPREADNAGFPGPGAAPVAGAGRAGQDGGDAVTRTAACRCCRRCRGSGAAGPQVRAGREHGLHGAVDSVARLPAMGTPERESQAWSASVARRSADRPTAGSRSWPGRGQATLHRLGATCDACITPARATQVVRAKRPCVCGACEASCGVCPRRSGAWIAFVDVLLHASSTYPNPP